MSLVLTAPFVAAGSEPSAAAHRSLLLAFDELVSARFNDRSFLIFTTQPQLEVGEVFVFGTMTNLNAAAYPAYDPADEEPPDPSSGAVVSFDTVTQVIWLTGYSSTPTLNRRTVDYDPGTGSETWWLGVVRPERWEPLKIADVLVENYTDPVTSTVTEFTWRDHWDHFGCIRIHNGNRFALTLTFEDASQANVVIPPYGILCGRRPAHDQPFAWESKYVHLTREGDPLRWSKWEQGQYAASMELLDFYMQEARDWCRFVPVIDNDSTASEQGSFVGHAPVGTDLFWDWLIHRGKLLSVVLDRRDGTTVIDELQWNGFGSVPDPTWAGKVSVSILADSITYTSAVTPPLGATADEWEHDLVPVTTNLTEGFIFQLQTGPVTRFMSAGGWDHYTDPLPVAELISASTPYHSTEDGGATTASVAARNVDPTEVFGSTLLQTLADHFPPTSGVTSGLNKAGAGIGRMNALSSSASMGMSEFNFDLLRRIDTSTSLLRWLTASHRTLAGRLRFTARHARTGHTADPDHFSHPQDKDLRGTPDGLGGPLGVEVKARFNSPLTIEGSPWVKIETATGNSNSLYGSTLLAPTDQLHQVISHINETGWWNANRDRIFAGTFNDESNGIAWRPHRIVEQWNAIARAINAVAEVYRADIRHLFKDPLPTADLHLPFTYSGEAPFAVPVGWICGRHDTDGSLASWAFTWSVTPSPTLPDVDTLAAIPAKLWASKNNGAGWIAVMDKVLYSTVHTTEVTETVNGHTYSFWNALRSAESRILFGGAGEWNDYVFIDYDEANVIFLPLGVHVPPPPTGERFNPVIEEDSSIVALSGGVSGSPGVGAVYLSRSVAQTVYRSPDPAGTWLATWGGNFATAGAGFTGREGIGFRICAAAGTELPIFTMGEASADLWHIWERQLSTAALDNGPISPRFKTLYGAAQFHVSMDDYIAAGPNAWISGTEVYSTTPFLLIAASELWCEFIWNTFATDYSADPNPTWQYSVTNRVPSFGGLNHKEYPAGSVGPATMIADGWSSHSGYHCQVVQRTGVLRA